MRHALFRQRRSILCTAAIVVGAAGVFGPFSGDARGAQAVFGGLTYNADDGTGYFMGEAPGGVNTAGTAVGFADKFTDNISKGARAVRWDISGNAEELNLAPFGSDANGFTNSYAVAVNASGESVGRAEKYIAGGDGTNRLARWSASGVAAELSIADFGDGTSGYDPGFATATAINDSGVAVGFANKYVAGVPKGTRSARWTSAGAMTELSQIPFGTNTGDANGLANNFVSAINASGTSVGTADKYLGVNPAGTRPARWDANGNATELSVADFTTVTPTNYDAYAAAVNASNVVVGAAEKYSSAETPLNLGLRPARWNPLGIAEELSIAPFGADGVDGSSHAYAVAVNDAGIVVGVANKYAAGSFVGTRAARWDADGTAAQLGTIPDAPGDLVYDYYFATAINSSGFAIGYADLTDSPGPDRRPVLWNPEGTGVDLNSFIDPADGWRLTYATAISDGMYVSGVGLFDPDGNGDLPAYERGFIIQVPEPAAGFSLAVVLGAYSLTRRRVFKRS